MADCKSGAIYKRADGLVVIDPEGCTGCRLCIDACPHDAIFFNDDLNIAQKCTGCAHLLDDGWTSPRCVDACPTSALKFGDENELRDMIKDAEFIDSDAGTKSRVYYLNLPKKWVAGTIYDPVEKEVIIGADCTLIDNESGEEFNVTTDFFGDFWIRGLKDNRRFSLRIVKNSKTKVFDEISTEKDVNLGDIPLE